MNPFPGGPLPKSPHGTFGPGGPGRPGGSGPMPAPGVDFPATKAQPRYRDLAYATLSPSQKLDLYFPNGNGPFPLVLMVHGGAFMFGDKADDPSKPGTDDLLEHGFAVANVNYRLSGEAKAPAQIQDVKAAVRWLRAHAKEFSLNPDKIGAWGASAGANLAALLGTALDVPALEGIELGNPEVSSRVQAVVDWFGPTDFLQMDRQLIELGFPPSHDDPDSPESLLVGAPIQNRPDLVKIVNPITYVTSEAAPFFIEHGTSDSTVPYLQSKILSDALVAAGGAERVTFVPLEGAVHGGGPQFWSPENIARVLGFLDHHLQKDIS
jgi:acetyl esterase/lipase